MFPRSVIRLTLVLVIFIASLLLIASFTITPVVARPQDGTGYVAKTGDDVGNWCLDQASPCATLQHAIDVANEFEEIRIATGVYTDVHTVGAIQIAALTKTLTLRGGFTTTDWLMANPVAYPTTLDGQGQWRALYALGDISPTYIGLRIVNGAAPSGGGLYALNTSTTISDCEFSQNSAGSFGGGVYASGPITITSSRFISNSTMYRGGAVYASTAAHVTDSHFEGNTANDDGGGLFASDAVTVANTDFISNSANLSGGGAYFSGTTTLTNTDFISNSAGQYGGGAEILGASALTTIHFLSNTAYYGGGLYAHYTSTLTNPDFSYNSAGVGGGLLADRTARLSGGQFTHNRCFGPACGGGGIFVGTPSNQQANLILSGVRFIANSAPITESVGGAVCYGGYGALHIVNTVFARNTAQRYGAALFVYAGQVANLHHLTISDVPTNSIAAVTINSNLAVSFINSIITNHAIGLQRLSGGVIEDHNLYYGNGANLTGMTLGPHDVVSDPRFIDSGSDNYALRFGSAAIDTGADDGVYADLDGNPRPIGNGFDIGAYEYQGMIYRVFLPTVQR